jgi:transcriptional regulator GlxA family with amidase domain
MSAQGQNEKTIAFVLYPGLTPFDLVGPLQVITQLARAHPEIRPVVVGERIEPMATDIGAEMIPERTFEEVPHPYALVVPGGTRPTFKAMSNRAIRDYVRSAAETAELVGSACTGALILASVGLLEGRQATTHWACYKVLESLGAKYRRERWVEDGKFITAAGVSAGIDMGLEFAARLTDEASAREVQLWLDYDPQPPFGGVDYDAVGLPLRVGRAWVSLTAPLLTARPKRLTRREQATGSRPVGPSALGGRR